MSEKDPIEELFRENQHGLDEKPRDLIWDRIEERLDEKSVVKKKSNFWKYGAAATIAVGLTLGVWAILNNQNYPKSEMTTPQMVLEEPAEINEENASEILDKLEENQDAIVLHESKEALPEAEMEVPKVRQTLPEPPTVEESALEDKLETYTEKPAPVSISSAPAMESPKKAKETEVIVFRGETPEKKEGNYVVRNKSETTDYELYEGRRLGNVADSKISYDQIESDTLKVVAFWVNISNAGIQYTISSNKKGSAIFTNPNVGFPKKIIVNHNKDNLTIFYEGDEKQKNSKESKEIQKYVNENKNSIFYPIEID